MKATLSTHTRYGAFAPLQSQWGTQCEEINLLTPLIALVSLSLFQINEIEMMKGSEGTNCKDFSEERESVARKLEQRENEIGREKCSPSNFLMAFLRDIQVKCRSTNGHIYYVATLTCVYLSLTLSFSLSLGSGMCIEDLLLLTLRHKTHFEVIYVDLLMLVSEWLRERERGREISSFHPQYLIIEPRDEWEMYVSGEVVLLLALEPNCPNLFLSSSVYINFSPLPLPPSAIFSNSNFDNSHKALIICASSSSAMSGA
jgi:hypothetical protein